MWRIDKALPYILSSLVLIAFGCGGEVQASGGGAVSFSGVFPSAACVRRSCADANASCGFIGDGCGDLVECGGAGIVNTGCPDQESCGGATVNQCSPGVCAPATSCGAKNCGFIGDGCAGNLYCGDCAFPEVCGAVEPNRCGTPSPEPQALDGTMDISRASADEFEVYGRVTLARADRENTLQVAFWLVRPESGKGIDLKTLDAELRQYSPEDVWDLDPQGTMDLDVEETDCHGEGNCLLGITATLHVTSSPVFVGDITLTAKEIWVEASDSGGGCSTSFPIPSK